MNAPGVTQGVRELAEGFMETARKHLTHDGYVAHLGICVRSAGPLEFMLCKSIPPELWPDSFRAMALRHHDYVAVFNVSEAWLKDDAPDLSRPASSYEDRREVITIEVKERDRDVAILIQPFDRDEHGRAIFPKPAEWLDGGISRALSLLP